MHSDHPAPPDPAQAAVIAHATGLLVVTGACGTGKTWALQERFVQLLRDGADPSRVALVVRSKAERFAIRDHLTARLGATPDLHVLTVHALAFAVLGSLAPAEEPPDVLDATQQFALVRELLQGEDPSDWPAYGSMLDSQGFAEQVRTFLLRAQEAAMDPEEIAARASRSGLTGFSELAGFARRYLDVLAASGRTDYPGLVLLAAAAADGGHRSFDHVMVDDHHDTTVATQLLLDALAPRSLVVAGRADGHVFGFQGTTDAPFLKLTATGPTRELLTGHRGTPHLRAWTAPHPSDECAAVAREIRRIHHEESVPWHQIAVVVRRTDAQLDGILRALDDAEVPRTAPDPRSPLAQAGTAPYISALRWCARPHDRDSLAEGLLAGELTGLGPAEARGLVRQARLKEQPPSEAFDHAASLHPRGREAVMQLRAALDAATAEAERSVAATFETLWKRLPHSRALVDAAERGDPEAIKQLDAVRALSSAIADHDRSGDASTEAFLMWIEAGNEGPGLAEADEHRNAVRVLTAHGAAGHEFDTVMIVGTLEGNFPSLSHPEPMFDLQALDGPTTQAQRTRDRLQDERRLFDMVLGRARRTVVCTAADQHDAGSAAARSRFLDDVAWRAVPQPPFGDPISAAEAAALWRRTLADPGADRVERLTALEGLLALGEDPSRWWYQLDWTDPGGPMRDRPRVSASRLSVLRDCELRFVLQEELGLSQRGNTAMWVGKFVHTLFEDAVRGALQPTVESLRAGANDRWKPQMFSSSAAADAWLRLITDTLIPRWVLEYADRQTLAVEDRFGFEFDGALVTGAIDRIGKLNDGCEITDYKTGKSRPSGDDAVADTNLQLGIYSLAMHEVPEFKRYLPLERIELAYIRLGAKGGGSYKVQKDFTDEDERARHQADVRATLSELIAQVRAIHEGAPITPDADANCRLCSLQPLCPLWIHSGQAVPV